MASEIFIVGGTGQIGRSAAARFAAEGWNVRIAGRDPANVPKGLAGLEFVTVDRTEPGALERVVGEPDVLLDVVPFTAEHGDELRALGARVGSVIAISSASVYADKEGRALDGVMERGYPDLPVPIQETQPTVEPGPETYSTQKVAMERALLADPNLRATIVRPCAIHGPGAKLPRELFFVKRARDDRRVVPLAHRGASRFHTTSVDNLTEMIWLAAVRPGRRVVNCGDPDPPAVLEIGRAIGGVLDHDFFELLLPGDPEENVGRTPWSVPHPLVVDMLTAELDLRYRPVTTYAKAVRKTVEWLVETNAEPEAYLAEMFDYAAEDAWLAALQRIETDR